MLELRQQSPLQTEVVKEQRKARTLAATLSPYPGHKVFKFTADGTLREVTADDYEEQDLTLNGGSRKSLVREPGSIYLSALNIKNAIKKLRKIGIVE